MNINEALKIGGSGPLKTCRGERFSRKTYQEEDWSLDESRDEKRLKMPNVKAKREHYQKEIGLKIPEELKQHDFYEIEKDAFNVDDSLYEARKMLPIKPFYKIIQKDRIQIIDDYKDRCPCLDFRKTLMRMRVYINRGA